MPLPQFGLADPVRVCDTCIHQPISHSYKSITKKRDKTSTYLEQDFSIFDQEQIDLEKAIQLSLQDRKELQVIAPYSTKKADKPLVLENEISEISNSDKDAIINFSSRVKSILTSVGGNIPSDLHDAYIDIFTYQAKFQRELEKISQKLNYSIFLQQRIIDSIQYYEEAIIKKYRQPLSDSYLPSFSYPVTTSNFASQPDFQPNSFKPFPTSMQASTSQPNSYIASNVQPQQLITSNYPVNSSFQPLQNTNSSFKPNNYIVNPEVPFNQPPSVPIQDQSAPSQPNENDKLLIDF
jgi:hypothetical protein